MKQQKVKTITLNFPDRLIVKKNTVRVTRFGTYYTKAWQDYEEKTIKEIKIQLNELKARYKENLKLPLTPPYRINYVYLTNYSHGKKSADESNLQEGINDILEKLGVIENDCFIDFKSIKRYRECKKWLTKVTIMEVIGTNKTVDS